MGGIGRSGHRPFSPLACPSPRNDSTSEAAIEVRLRSLRASIVPPYTQIESLSFSNFFSPMPLTRWMSSIEANGPPDSRSSMIA